MAGEAVIAVGVEDLPVMADGAVVRPGAVIAVGVEDLPVMADGVVVRPGAVDLPGAAMVAGEGQRRLARQQYLVQALLATE